MNEIMSYFFNPEESMELLLSESNKNKWKDGVVKWLLVAIVAGLLTIMTYRMSGVEIAGIQEAAILQNILGVNNQEGIIWLGVSVANIIETLLIAVIRTLVWAGLLYVANKILKDELSLYEVLLMSIFCILTWITSQIFSSIALMISMVCSVQVINEMLLGIVMILGYWYLIVFIIGYSVATRSTFLKSGTIVLIIQGIFWGVANAFPVLQVILG